MIYFLFFLLKARQRIEELIDSVHRRDTDGGGRGGGMRGGGGRDRYDGRGSNSRNGNNQEYGGWDDRRSQQQQQQQQQQPQEVTFTVPSGKCGVIIGRGMYRIFSNTLKVTFFIIMFIPIN